MDETRKFTLPDENQITIQELGANEVLLMMEEAEINSIALTLTRAEAHAIGLALMTMGRGD
jgi:hypothetical protein